MASHLIVDIEFVKTAPLGFQRYIEEWFLKEVVLGREVYSATRYIHGYMQFGRVSKGSAPRHSVDLMGYDKDMPGGMSLSTWIYDQVKKGTHMWEFHGGEDPHECHSYDDD